VIILPDNIKLEYCPRTKHSGEKNLTLNHPRKTCKDRIYDEYDEIFICKAHTCTHKYCVENNIESSLEQQFRCVLQPEKDVDKIEMFRFHIKHGKDFTKELAKARLVAEYGIENDCRSSKDVKHIGLNSVIANAILKRYVYKYKRKPIEGDVPLIIPKHIIIDDKHRKAIWLASLRVRIPYGDVIDVSYDRIQMVEIDKKYATVYLARGE